MPNQEDDSPNEIDRPKILSISTFPPKANFSCSDGAANGNNNHESKIPSSVLDLHLMAVITNLLALSFIRILPSHFVVSCVEQPFFPVMSQWKKFLASPMGLSDSLRSRSKTLQNAIALYTK